MSASRALFRYLSSSKVRQPKVKIAGVVFEAKPWPMNDELTKGDVVVYRGNQYAFCEVAIVQKKFKDIYGTKYTIKFLPSADGKGALSGMTLDFVPIENLTHVLKKK